LKLFPYPISSKRFKQLRPILNPVARFCNWGRDNGIGRKSV